MKKFRFLAMLLAILMLPISLLVACNNDETPPDDGIENPGDGETPGDGTTSGDGDDDKKDEVVYDKDGTLSGYLMFFNFDAAKRGDLKHDTKPYSSYLEITEGAGLSYIVTDLMAKNKNSLLIQRENSASNAKLDIKLDNISKISAEHTIEFDVRVGKGYITDDISIYGSKLTSDAKTVNNTFVVLTDKGVYDATENLIYEYKEEDSWINIAIGIDDSQRTYNIYVNGAKYSNDIAYSSVSYANWATSRTNSYSFESGKEKKDFYLHIDNLAILSGQDPTIRDSENDNIIYTDVIDDELHFFNFNSKEAYFNRIDELYKSKLKSEPYGAGLPLYNTYSIYRVNNNSDDRYTPVTYDYGVELGIYNYGADFGNKKFVLDENNYFFFKSNAELEFIGKLGGSDIAGTYKLASDGTPTATLNYEDENGSTKVCYVRYEDATGNITYDTSNKFNVYPATYTADVQEYSEFNGKIYGYTVSDMRVTVVVYEAIGLADLFIESTDSVDVDLKNAPFTYENGVITITAEDESYSFTYADDEADGTFTYEEKTFGLFDKWQTMECETLCTYYGEYKSFGYRLSYKESAFIEAYDADEWMGKLKIKYFVPESGLGYTLGLYIANLDHPTATGTASYWMIYEDGKTAGWKELTLDLTTLDGARVPNIYDLTGEFAIEVDGWPTQIGVNADGKPGKKEDGYGIIISEVKFYGTKSVNVKGPSADKADCTHEDENGETYFVEGDVIASTCTSIGYTELKCSECGATKVDKTKPFTRYTAHIFDETATPQKSYPTCTEDGYTYRTCEFCKKEIRIDDLEAVGHDNYSYYDAAEKMMRVCCKACGYIDDYAFIEKFMTAQEKVESETFKSYTYKFDFAVWEGHNDNTTFPAGSKINGFNFTNKGNIAQSGCFEDGSHYLEFMRGDVPNSDPYAALSFSTDDKLGIGANLVFEMDIKLGRKAADGKYLQMAISARDRNHWGAGVAYGKNLTLFIINELGEIVIRDSAKNEDVKIPLSEEKFVNLALAINPSKNKVSVYIDGYLEYDNIGLTFGDISNLTISNLYIECSNREQENECKTNASHYFNGILLYPAEKPLCVLTKLDNVINEHLGEVYLEIANKTPVGPAFSVTDAPVELKMPQYTATTKYVLDFKLTADELVDGTILTGIKNDEYRFENRQDIITVKDGYVYYLDTAICPVSEAADGVRITLETNDKDGNTVVYINGNAISGGAVEYGDKYGFYGLGTSYIIGYIFDSSVGAYEITDLRMYTGALETNTEATPAE